MNNTQSQSNVNKTATKRILHNISIPNRGNIAVRRLGKMKWNGQMCLFCIQSRKSERKWDAFGFQIEFDFYHNSLDFHVPLLMAKRLNKFSPISNLSQADRNCDWNTAFWMYNSQQIRCELIEFLNSIQCLFVSLFYP